MEEAKILGRNMKRARQFRGLTQTELGQKVGLTKDTISKVELAKQNIGIRQLFGIRRELGVAIEELFMRDSATVYLKIVLSRENVKTLERIVGMFRKLGLFSKL